MILEKNTVTITKAALKKYTAAGAIVLQLLYDKYGGVFELDIDKWREDELDFLSAGEISSALTLLRKNGHISVEGNTVYIHDRKKRVDKDEKPEEKKTERKRNDAWEMALVIQKVTKVNPKLITPNRYLSIAKKLIKAGYTEEFILKHYSDSGWWYREDFRGQKGQPPNQGQILQTVSLVGKSFNNNNFNNNSSDKADSVFK